MCVCARNLSGGSSRFSTYWIVPLWWAACGPLGCVILVWLHQWTMIFPLEPGSMLKDARLHCWVSSPTLGFFQYFLGLEWVYHLRPHSRASCTQGPLSRRFWMRRFCLVGRWAPVAGRRRRWGLPIGRVHGGYGYEWLMVLTGYDIMFIHRQTEYVSQVGRKTYKKPENWWLKQGFPVDLPINQLRILVLTNGQTWSNNLLNDIIWLKVRKHHRLVDVPYQFSMISRSI